MSIDITTLALAKEYTNRMVGSGQNVNNVFAGKTAIFFGDSLTEANYHYKKGYHAWVKEILGLGSYTNYGVSGYKVSDVYNKVNSVTDAADIVFVMCGVNDQGFSVPLGEMGDNTTGTTYGALNLLCALLKQKYPTSIIVFITPHYQIRYTHDEGITSCEVSKAIREVCEKYAIPVYDNYSLSGIYTTNLSVFTTDNCHWNDNGHEMVGKNLAAYMLNTFHYVYSADGSGGGNSGGDTTVAVTGVSLNKTSGTLPVGGTITLTATVSPASATNKAVSWVSSNQSVATVAGGVVTAVSVGGATITATTADGGFTATYALTVEGQVEESNVEISIINDSVESATYSGNMLTMTGLNRTYGGIVLDNAAEVRLDVSVITNPDGGKGFGWLCARDGDTYRAFGIGSGKIETWDFPSGLGNPTNRGEGAEYPASGTVTVKRENGAVNMYFGAELAYSTTGDAIGYILSQFKKATIPGMTITTV